MKRRIAILFHESYRKRRERRVYAIESMADFWKEDGHEVKFLFGVKRFVPADIVIVHVDLSVVPDEYLDFAGRYPVALNGRVKDVRKSSISGNLVGAGDAYGGRVIVKSDLNHAGAPERLVLSGRPGGWAGLFRKLRSGGRGRALESPPAFPGPTDYRIYDSPADVPRDCFDREDIVVEKFLPEMKDDLYCLRLFHFLGDRMACVRIASPHPIVKADNKVFREIVEPHPEILELRRSLQFDFGKFDYVVHDGRVVLLDPNKTPGEGPATRAVMKARLRHLASGLSSWLS